MEKEVVAYFKTLQAMQDLLSEKKNIGNIEQDSEFLGRVSTCRFLKQEEETLTARAKQQKNMQWLYGLQNTSAMHQISQLPDQL